MLSDVKNLLNRITGHNAASVATSDTPVLPPNPDAPPVTQSPNQLIDILPPTRTPALPPSRQPPQRC